MDGGHTGGLSQNGNADFPSAGAAATFMPRILAGASWRLMEDRLS